MQSDVNFPLVLCKPTSQIIQPKFNQCKRFVLRPHFSVIYLTISILGSSIIFGLSLKYTLRFVPSTKMLFYAIYNNIFHYTSFQPTSPFPISSSSMARAITLRLSALNGSAYCLAFICSSAASTPPLLLSFSSST